MRFGKLAMVVGLGLLAAGQVLAQPGGGGFGGRGGGGLVNQISNNKGLQDELKVDADQLKTLTDALTKVREETRDDSAKLRDRNTSAEDRAAITKKISAATEKAVASVLKEPQIKRLHQIENQQAGVGMFSKEDVQSALKLNDSQKEKIDEINKELQKELRDLTGAGGKPGGGKPGGGGGFGGLDPETQKKRQGLQKEALDSAVKLLKGDQKTVYKDLTGEPFELTLAAPGGGGFGGFGGRATPPGTVLSTATQDTLKLTADQKKELEVLQKEVDAKLAKLLTAEQLKQMKDLATPRQPGGGRPGGNPNPNPNP